MTTRKVLWALVIAAGCGGGSKTKAGQVTSGGMTSTGAAGGQVQDLRIPKVDEKLCDTKDKKVATFDLNHDDKPDMWKLYVVKAESGGKSEYMTCKQVDLDHDGRKDYVAQYDVDGNLIVEEVDTERDGKFDARYHYDKRNHRLFLVERETGYDGKPDLWEEWAYTEHKDQNEWLSRILRDRNADEKPDYWELYKKVEERGKDVGELESILWDDDFDGKVERREDAAKPTPPPAEGGEATPPAEGGGAGAKPGEGGEGGGAEKPAEGGDAPAEKPAEKKPAEKKPK